MDASQEQIIQKINYLFISGDIIEGVGIYPSQEKDLEIMNQSGLIATVFI